MALEVRLSRDAARRLSGLPSNLKNRLVLKIREIAENPMLKGSRQLRGHDDLYRVRVGGWRIIYSWNSTTLQIEEIGARGQVYKDLLR
jgi:mRNA interferase RelE/StbE